MTRATTASTGEIVNIITVTPTSVSNDVRIWLTVCCRLWQGCRCRWWQAEQVAARLAIDVAQRQPVELVLDRLAQSVHRALYDTGQDVRLPVGEQPRRRVQGRRQHQLAMKRRSIDALIAGDTLHDDVGRLAEQAGRAPRAPRRRPPTPAPAAGAAARGRGSGRAGARWHELVAALHRHGDAAARPERAAARLSTGGGEDRRSDASPLRSPFRSGPSAGHRACWEATISAWVSHVASSSSCVPAPTTRRPRARGSGRRADRRGALGDDHHRRRRARSANARPCFQSPRSSAEKASSNT